MLSPLDSNFDCSVHRASDINDINMYKARASCRKPNCSEVK